MSYYESMPRQCQLCCTLWFLAIRTSAEYCFSALFHGTCYESADAFARVFSGFGDHFGCGFVQVAGDAVRKSFPRSTTFAAVAFLGHGHILTTSAAVVTACETRGTSLVQTISRLVFRVPIEEKYTNAQGKTAIFIALKSKNLQPRTNAVSERRVWTASFIKML